MTEVDIIANQIVDILRSNNSNNFSAKYLFVDFLENILIDLKTPHVGCLCLYFYI